MHVKLAYARQNKISLYAVQEHHDCKIEYRCTGATLSNEQPGTFASLITAAQSYAQKNQGDKYQAILWPFSALDSYNRAEQQYSGQRMPWSQHGGQLLKDLNLEHSKLLRLEHTMAMRKGPANPAAKKKVTLQTMSTYQILCFTCALMSLKSCSHDESDCVLRAL